MKKIVVDTNIIFSILLNKSKKLRDVFFGERDLSFYSCKYIAVELFKKKEKIRRYSSLEEDEIVELLYSILKRICLFDEDTLTDGSLKKAFELCEDIDEKDVLFVALTVELEGLLWTGDKKLKERLREKGFDFFFEP